MCHGGGRKKKKKKEKERGSLNLITGFWQQELPSPVLEGGEGGRYSHTTSG